MKVIDRESLSAEEVRILLGALTSLRKGDDSARLPLEWTGLPGKISEAFNNLVDLNEGIARELARLRQVVGKQGKLNERGSLGEVRGFWKDSLASVNGLIDDLVHPTSETARVIGAVAQGDLAQSMALEINDRPLEGEFLRTARTVNKMVDQLSAFAAEVTRVAREVGTEGKLGGQAKVKGVAGTWKDLTDSVNSMAGNLTGQVRNIADVTTAVAKGDLSRKITVDVKGEFLELKNTINTMVDQLRSFASEVTRVAREVGTEGRLGGQAVVQGVSGTWKDLTDGVNSMASNLTAQVRNIAHVTTAVARGDLSRKITVDVKGEILELKNTVNTMVDQLSSFAAEVTRVAREVGTEGRLGGQADVRDVAGTWKDLTDSVNFMASNLTAQVRNIADVTTAVASGDLSRKITVDVKGEISELKITINTMVDQLRSFAAEVTRVAREVGTEGRLGGQAEVQGVAGTWKDLTDSVNSMASNLTAQVRNIAEVTTAVARGDLSKKITVDVKGEILELKDTVNTMVDQLSSFAAEVTRVAREVGTEGRLGGQAEVQGVAGTWKDLTDSVNFMAGDLTAQVRNIAEVTTAVAKGDLSKKITVDVKGEIQELKNTINTMVDQLRSFAAEVTRVAREVGTEGKLGGQADVQGVAGTWKDLTDSVNSMASNLTAQVRNIAEVTTAVATGDLSKKITVDVKGEIQELKNTINTMVDQLGSFAAEVTRVAREVGTDGRLGGQARVPGVSGTWKDLTDSVNFMAGNLTGQVRGIAKVVSAVADGDLQQKLTVQAKGEIAALADTINGMIDTLARLAEQVTSVAREVGVEGKLGGQAKVPGASGTWKGLTENVNQLAENLTTQVRAIAEVATAVTQGDLTRSITVQAQGEVAALKDTINEMIRNLRDTTRKNTEQDWLKTNLAKFSRMLQGQKALEAVGELILSELAPVVAARHAEFYVLDTRQGDLASLVLVASYASQGRTAHGKRLDIGQGLVGQCAVEKRKILMTNVPADYMQISSGLGRALPRNILVLPIVFETQIKGVLELASFEGFSDTHQAFLEQLTESIGIVINTIEANTRTEDLLKQSQSLAFELQNRQEELQQTNEALQDKAKLLAHQNAEVERKNQEVEQARQALEDKARQLALTSKYKSEFLANMSHELRTPLNSLLILSDQLSNNNEHNLSEKQVEFARIIHSSGNELLGLINDILDLSKIESGTVAVAIDELRFDELQRYVERTFRHVAESKNVEFSVRLDAALPGGMFTDVTRLQQIIKNLLSNAFKFTRQGQVIFSIEPAGSGWSADNDELNRAPEVLAFRVADTGVGIPLDKQQIIFEAFQQVDGSTSRKFGGTGLGLAISRELSRLLRGEIGLTSTPGRGSEFVLYLPRAHPAAEHSKKTIDAPGRAAMEPVAQPAARARRPAGRPAALMPAPALQVVRDIDEVGDDRNLIRPGERVLLIVESDAGLGRSLLHAAREKGFRGLVTSHGASALALVRSHQPCAVLLDTHLDDIDGWRVLGRMKMDLATRHIPVYILAAADARERALRAGARDFIAKPIRGDQALHGALDAMHAFLDRTSRRVLVMGKKPSALKTISDFIQGMPDVEVLGATDLQDAHHAIDGSVCDCVVCGEDAPHSLCADLARRMRQSPLNANTPFIMLRKGEPGAADACEEVLATHPRARQVHSLERLLDQTTLALHRGIVDLPSHQRDVLTGIYQSNKALAQKKVLIVDDDVRNIFALSSVLEQYDMKIMSAENGRAALDILGKKRDIDIVLMDVMMPDLDGLATMREVRAMQACKQLPIVALTAKAMKGDRERCMAAGAWDYLSKPVDREQLLGVLRAWLQR